MCAEQWMNGQSPRTGLLWSSRAFILNLENARKIGPSVSVLYQDSKKLQNLTIANSIMCDNLEVTQDAFVYNTLCVCVCVCERERICQSWTWLCVKSCVSKSVQIWMCVWMIVYASVCVFVYVYVPKWTDLRGSVRMCVPESTCTCMCSDEWAHCTLLSGCDHTLCPLPKFSCSWCPDVSENYATSFIHSFNLTWDRVKWSKTRNYWLFRKIGNHYCTE